MSAIFRTLQVNKCCEENATTKCGSKNEFYTLLYIIIWLLMAILSWLQLIQV